MKNGNLLGLFCADFKILVEIPHPQPSSYKIVWQKKFTLVSFFNEIWFRLMPNRKIAIFLHLHSLFLYCITKLCTPWKNHMKTSIIWGKWKFYGFLFNLLVLSKLCVLKRMVVLHRHDIGIKSQYIVWTYP